MKKLFGLALAGAVAVSITACGSGAAETTAAETTAAETTAAESTETETSESVNEAATLGEALLYDFETRAAENAEATAQEIAEGLLANEQILFSGAVVSVEEGMLAGFGETEITGFEEGAMFAPMISTIPFVGYVFDMENADAAEELAEVLTENADPRWNICTEAEETVVGTAEDKVFFVMCPESLEE